MEINHLLLFGACASAVFALLQAVRRRTMRPVMFAAIVLTGAAAAWFVAPKIAGYVAAMLWIALLIAPSFDRERWTRVRDLRLRITPAVGVLLFLNAATFAVELALGGSMNPSVLHKLGELDTFNVLARGEYWRIFTALFLHYGVAHLALNLLGLYVIGLPLEVEAGSLRLLCSYVISGLASGTAVVGLAKLRLLPPLQLVGASGAVMGIVGAWIGLLFRNRHTPFAMQRLRHMLLLVLLQVAFDVVTPRVSLVAHVAGLLSGVLLGIVFAEPAEENACRY